MSVLTTGCKCPICASRARGCPTMDMAAGACRSLRVKPRNMVRWMFLLKFACRPLLDPLHERRYALRVHIGRDICKTNALIKRPERDAADQVGRSSIGLSRSLEHIRCKFGAKHVLIGVANERGHVPSRSKNACRVGWNHWQPPFALVGWVTVIQHLYQWDIIDIVWPSVVWASMDARHANAIRCMFLR